MRLFTAFSMAIDSSLATAIKRTRIGAQQRDMEVNWSPEAGYHVTLCFLGETDPERMPALREVLASVASRHAPFSTSLRGLGAFPDERHARVLWVGVRKSRALSEAQDDLREALQAAGFVMESRDYLPHLTIGRLRKARSVSDLLSPYVRSQFGDVDVAAIQLYESVHQGSHPVYRVLESFALVGQT